MARASTKAWISMAMGVVLGAADPAAAQSPAAGNVTAPPSAAPVRQGRAQYALTTALECHKRGEYDVAATWFQQAQAGLEELNETQRIDLSIGVQLNQTAVKSRRDGGELLRKAEQAVRANRAQEARTFLQSAAAHQQHLTTADKQAYRLLEGQLRPGAPTPGQNNLQHARAKLQQARVLLAQGNVDGAEKLVREADQLGVTYPANEDTPRKVMEDVTKARRGRPSTERTAAPNPGKGPTKDSGVTRTGMTSAPPKSGDSPKPTMKGADVARQLMKQSRQALKAGDLTVAMKLATEATAYKQDLSWWDENPDKLVAEIQKAEAGRRTTGTSPAAVANNSSQDPRLLVKRGREAYAAGNLAEAERLALQANSSARGVRWGLFDDSPDKLLIDIRKATQKRDQEESARLLVEARRTYEKSKGDPQLLAQALEMANKAERLHGPYGAWDFGDKPSKLRGEIETVQARNRQRGILPAAPTAVAQNNTNTNARPATSPATVQASTLPPPTPPSLPPPTVVTKPEEPRIAQVEPKATGIPLIPAGTFTPDVTPPTVAPPPQAMPPVVAPPPVSAPVEPPLPVVDDTKQRAKFLLADARKCQTDGNLIEARRLGLEAQNLKASFALDEESPDKFLAALAAQANRHVDGLTAQGKLTDLHQARELAAAFGFDTKPIETKLAALTTPPPPPAPITAPIPAPTPAPAIAQAAQPLPGGTPARQRGEELLRQARLELNRGETAAARRLAVEAFSGNFGVQADAEKVLRSIDAEEFNQRILAANRSYEAGVNALQRQDSAQALTIFRTLDPSLLPPEKQTKLREILVSLDPAQPAAKPSVPGSATPPTTSAVSQAKTPAKDDTYAQQVKALQDVKYQQLREEGIRVQKDAMDQFQAGHTDRALELLDDHLAALRSAQLEPQRIAMLRRPVEVRREHFKAMKAQRDFDKLSADQRKQHGQIAGNRQLTEDNKNKQVAELMKQYHTFHKEGKYREAEMYAMRALELDPDNPQASAAVYTARTMKNQTGYTNIKNEKAEFFREGMDDAEKTGPPVNSIQPVQFDAPTMARIKDRKSLDTTFGGPKTEKERQIERRLHTPVNLEFKNSSLEKALQDLQEMTSINIHLDRNALREAGIATDQPVSVSTVEPIALKSALSILLKEAGLMYHIEDEVLKVTTAQHAKGKLITRTFPVADLVLPIHNYTLPSREEILRINPTPQNLQIGGIQPYLGRNAMQGGQDVSPATLGSHANQPSQPGSSGWHRSSAKGTIEDLLMKLIGNTISPNSWSEMGGPGTIDYYPLGMALIVNQTPDIQEQIAELLQALRRLQDQEVAVEVRFVTIAESFFERIGLDFNVNIKTNNTRYEPQIVTQQFKPFGYINDFEPRSTVIGLTPAGSFTSDLDIPIRTSSFAQAIPPFGAFPNIPGGNGGLELGLAFLSDIQVFLFMEAAQGDQRTNVMQAPKLTLNNGQTATISIEDQQYFVTNVNVVQGGGQIVFVPTNQLLTIGGTSVTIQAVISADRRFVRLSLSPTLTNLASAVVQLFPITTFITPVFEGGAQGQPVPFTQFIQQPVFNTVRVETTVTVPDGGTVLMGGLKRLSEGRNEFGPPILSKLPYINRLFKNVGYGREAESLLMMVTPRIIINEEEEEKFLRANPPASGQPVP